MMSGVIASTMKRLAEQHDRYGLDSALARASGVTPTSARRWLLGEVEPKPVYWPAIEQFFDLVPGTLASSRASLVERTLVDALNEVRAEIAKIPIDLFGDQPTDAELDELARLHDRREMLDAKLHEMRLRRLPDVVNQVLSRLDQLEARVKVLGDRLLALGERTLLPDDDEVRRPDESRTAP